MSDHTESDVSAPERLETGWFADTPTGDTLLRRFVVADAEWMEAVARASGGPALRTEDFLVVDEHSEHLLLNSGILLRPVEPDRAAGVAAEILAFFTGAGGPFSLFAPWPTSLPGLEVGGYPPFMLRPPGGEAPKAPPELDIRVATTVDGLGDYERVLVDGFPLESLQPWRPGIALHPANLHVPDTAFFVGRVDGRPVTVATSLVGCGVNHVEFVATLPDARGRGYGEAVTWAATMAAPDLPAMLIATDMGRPVYERMGYVALMRWTFLVGTR
jgi:GNAT superfamily N-acetyltransferase